jgi:hypothetical protein
MVVDLSRFKIPVLEGINDSPLQPNFNDNGRGSNGSYFVEKHNALIDALLYGQPSFVSFAAAESMGSPPYRYEVGSSIYLSPTPLVFNYELLNSDGVKRLEFYYGETLVETRLGPFSSSGSFSYEIENQLDPPNYFDEPTTVEFSILGINGYDDPFTASLSLTWAQRVVVGFSSAPDVETFYDNRFAAINDQSKNYRVGSITKEVSVDTLYLYIFLPIGETGYEPYTQMVINGVNAGFNTTEAEIERFGVTNNYLVYRSMYPTKGGYVLNLA